MRCRGLNLIEVLVAVCLIAVLAVVSLPMLTRANGEARSAACRANLTTLGQLLQRNQDAHGRLPSLMNRDDNTLAVPTLDRLMPTGDPERAALRCPSDRDGVFERTGTSYQWFASWDNRSLHHNVEPVPITPLIADKAPFHTNQQHPFNALFPAIVQPDTRPGPYASTAPFFADSYAMPY